MNDAFGSIYDYLNSDVLSSASDFDSVDFSHLGRSGFPFSVDNFHPLPVHFPAGDIAFIDGGNAEIIASSSLNLSFLRIFHSVYRDNKRVSFSKDEFFCLVSAYSSGGELFFHAKLFPYLSSFLPSSFFDREFSFGSKDPLLTTRNSVLSISAIPSLVRRLAELSTALQIVGSMAPGASVVIDGSLEHKTADEKKLLDRLSSLSLSENISIAALSKTTSLLTSSGSSPLFLLDSRSPLPAWSYFPVVDIPDFDLYFVKLHPASRYVFRLDAFHSGVFSDLLAHLVRNSSDPVFFGYPYGLVEADRFARVSNSEKEYLKTAFLAGSGSASKALDVLMRSSDAHSVLDHIS